MSGKHPEGYLALPASGEGPGVLVLHTWWGLNATMKQVCRRLAQAGYAAFAPDLYHGQVADTIAGAEELGSALDENHEQAKAETAAAARFLAGQTGGEIAVIGFSLGAYYALDLSAADPEHVRAVVVFYGSGPAEFSQSRAAYLGHFAADDPYEPPENVEWLQGALQEAGRPATFYQYPETGHWFFEPDRTDAFKQAEALLAWERTLAFLQEQLQ